MHPDKLITAEEVAAHLSVRPPTVLEWARRGTIPSLRCSSKTIRFRLGAVLKALDGKVADDA